MFTLGIFTIVSMTIAIINSLDYCSLPCGAAQNTMCIYSAGGPSQCSEYQSGLTNEERQLILDLHNQFRQRVANGWEKRGAQPSSSNMMQLDWDQEAEIFAQRWADQCQTKGHDGCRRRMSGQVMGQNIAWQWYYSTGAQVTREQAIRTMVSGLYDEVSQYRGSINNYVFDSRTGHYTQMAWATTSAVGCGFTQRLRGYELDLKLVCDYSPAGNYIGLPIYRIGLPCSECPAGTSCSSKYPGLCHQ